MKYAVPVFSGGALVKLEDGAHESVSVVALDDTSLFGRPPMESGNIDHIFAENSFIVVHDSEFSKLGNPRVGTRRR